MGASPPFLGLANGRVAVEQQGQGWVVRSNCEECIFQRFVCVPELFFLERDTRVVLLTFATYDASAASTVTIFYTRF